MSREDRQAAWQCNITYVTAKEAGFDFLRDQLSQHRDHQVQRGFHVAIVDEADSILIDEARIPLVIATEAERDKTDLKKIVSLIRPLRKGVHFAIKASGRNIALTDTGIRLLERQLGISELHSEEYMHLHGSASWSSRASWWRYFCRGILWRAASPSSQRRILWRFVLRWRLVRFVIRLRSRPVWSVIRLRSRPVWSVVRLRQQPVRFIIRLRSL